jgi:hypothetical protein
MSKIIVSEPLPGLPLPRIILKKSIQKKKKNGKTPKTHPFTPLKTKKKLIIPRQALKLQIKTILHLKLYHQLPTRHAPHLTNL